MTTPPNAAALADGKIPVEFYQWLYGIERDVRVWDLTPNEVGALVAALRAKPAGEVVDDATLRYCERQWADERAVMLSKIEMLKSALGFDPDGPCGICGGVEGCSHSLAERCRTRPATESDGRQGYVDAFYEIAAMLGIPAQNKSPREVFETQIRPRIAALANQPKGEG